MTQLLCDTALGTRVVRGACAGVAGVRRVAVLGALDSSVVVPGRPEEWSLHGGAPDCLLECEGAER